MRRGCGSFLGIAQLIALLIGLQLTVSVAPAAADPPLPPGLQVTPDAPPHSAAEMQLVSDRGRYLADYDQAAWHSTDAVFAHTARGTPAVRMYIGLRAASGWVLDYGTLADDRTAFLTSFEAVEHGGTYSFAVNALSPPRRDQGTLLGKALAYDTARNMFGPQRISYNFAVMPLADGRFFIYIYVAQASNAYWPLGGDERFLFSSDGQTLLARRRLHQTIINIPVPRANVVAGFNHEVISDLPQETDVFYALSHHIQEYVYAQDRLYSIDLTGTIHYVGTVRSRS